MLSRIQSLKSDLHLSELEGNRYGESFPTVDDYTGKLVGGFENSLRKEQTQLYKVQLQLDHLENYRYDTLREYKDTYSKLYYELQDRKAALEQASRRAEREEAEELARLEAQKAEIFRNQRRRIEDLSQRRRDMEEEIRTLHDKIDADELKHQRKKASLAQAVADINMEIETLEDRKRELTAEGDQLYVELEKLRQRYEVLAARKSAERKRLHSVKRDYQTMRNDYKHLKHAK